MKVEVVNGNLLVTAQGSKLPMRALDQTTFEPLQHAGRVKFAFRKSDGKITGIDLSQGGTTQFLPREESAQ